MGTKTFSKKLIAFVSAVTLSIGATLGATSLNLTDIFSKDSEIVASATGQVSGGGRPASGLQQAKPGQVTLSSSVGCRIYLAKNSIFTRDPKGITTSTVSELDVYKDCAVYELSGVFGSSVNSGYSVLNRFGTGGKAFTVDSRQILSSGAGYNNSTNAWNFGGVLYSNSGVTPFSHDGGAGCMNSLATWANTTFSDSALGEKDKSYSGLNTFLTNYRAKLGDSNYVGHGLPKTSSEFIQGKWSIIVEPLILTKANGGVYAISFNDFIRPQDTQTTFSGGNFAIINGQNSYIGSGCAWKYFYDSDHSSISRSSNDGVGKVVYATLGEFYADFTFKNLKINTHSSDGGKCAGFGVFATSTSFTVGSKSAKVNKNFAFYTKALTADGKTVGVETQENQDSTLKKKGTSKLHGYNEGCGQTTVTNTDVCTRYITFDENNPTDTGATASWFKSSADLKFNNIGFYTWSSKYRPEYETLKGKDVNYATGADAQVGTKGGSLNFKKLYSRMLGGEKNLYSNDSASSDIRNAIGNYVPIQAYTSVLVYKTNTKTSLSNLYASMDSSKIHVASRKVVTSSGQTDFELGSNYTAYLYYGDSKSRSSLDSIALDIANKMSNGIGALNHTSYAGGKKDVITMGEEVSKNGSSRSSSEMALNSMMNMSTAGLVNSGISVNAAGDTYGSDKDTKQSKIGISVEMLVPEILVKSYAQIIHRDKTGKITLSKKYVSDPYSIYTDYAEFNGLIGDVTSSLKGKTSFMLAFPNKSAYADYSLEKTDGSTVANSVFPTWTLSSQLGYAMLTKFAKVALSSTDTDILVRPTSWSGDIVIPAELRAAADGSKFTGFTLYYIVDEYETPVKDTTMNLKANELNYIYPTTLGDTRGVLIKTISTKYLNTFNIDKNTSKDNSYSGTLIDAEKSSKGINLLYSTLPINGKPQLFDLEAKDRKSFTNITTNVTLNHAVNMVRGSYNDKYVVSSFNKANTNFAGTHFYNDVLRLSIGNVGSSVPSSIGSGKTGVSATGYDRFRWSCDRAASIGYDVVSNGQTYRFTYSATPFEGGQSQTNAGYNVNETINRYVTVDKSTASNATSGMISTGRVKATNSAYGYRAYSVKNYDKTFKFYPEVAMSAWKYDDSKGVLNSYSDVTHGTVYVLGEKVRSLKATAMYGIAVNGAANGKNLAGATKSDTVAAGSDAKALSKKFNNLQVIYAGGNVNVAASGNFSIDLSGFALDQIDKDKDKKLITSNGNGVYTDVVSDNSNLKKTWGSDAYDAQSEYQKWVEEVKNSLAVDMSLQVSKDLNGQNVVKNYNGYKASVGKVDGGNIESTTSYALTYKNGVVVEDTAYAELIKALRQYAGVSSDAEAKAMFEASGINKEILSSIESSTNGSSEKVDGFAGDHWYDETVRTFVVRYYKCAPIKMSNITVSDKIDINAGPSQSTKSKTLFSNGYVGKWYLTVYLKSANSAMPSLTLYDAKKQNYDADSVLIAKQHVEQADFVIPDATTADARK